MAEAGSGQLLKRLKVYGVFTALALGTVGGCHAITDQLSAQSDLAANVVVPVMQDADLVTGQAEDFVMTYLSLRRGQEELLRRFVTAEALKLPPNPIPATDPVINFAKPVGNRGEFKLWTVVISVSQNDVTSGTYSRVYYQVPMGITQGRPRALDLPAVISPPEIGFDAAQAYSQELAANDLLAKTVQGFLDAYTTGTGDIRSFQTSDAMVKAITPPPFRDIKFSTIRSNGITGDTKPETEEATGSVKVSAVGHSSNYTTVSLTYFLAVRWEGNRWLVSGIDRAPALADTDAAKASATATATPTTTATPIPSAVAR